jgi:hypothetical protein
VKTDVDVNVVFFYMIDNESVTTQKDMFTSNGVLLNNLTTLQRIEWNTVVEQFVEWQSRVITRHGAIVTSEYSKDTRMCNKMQRGVVVVEKGTQVCLSRSGTPFQMTTDGMSWKKKKLYGVVEGFVNAKERTRTDKVNSIYAIVKRCAPFPTYLAVPVRDVDEISAYFTAENMNTHIGEERGRQLSKIQIKIGSTTNEASEAETVIYTNEFLTYDNIDSDDDEAGHIHKCIPLQDVENRSIKLYASIVGYKDKRGSRPANVKNWLLGYATVQDAVTAAESIPYDTDAYAVTPLELDVVVDNYLLNGHTWHKCIIR